ncbi:MAG: PASTA domain-containing protein [Bacteroidota bacterium]|nr:PASTA domain-containing protein [Bacteroidota bacterium]
MTTGRSGVSGGYLKSKDFKSTAIAVFLFLAISFLSVFLWLKIYTHHGQELELPDYVGQPYEDAAKNARRKKFRMSVLDSIHVLGKPGGIILKQDPPPHTLVKEKRMIYTTITKRSPDKILSGRLPEMYGKNFERKKRELQEHFEIKSRVIEKRFDPGDPNQILEVRYKGETLIDSRGRNNDIMIEKGDELEFIISERSGAIVEVPDLVCKTYEEAQFLLENLGLLVGSLSGDTTDEAVTYIIEQEPAAGEEIKMESAINLTIRLERPARCE